MRPMKDNPCNNCVPPKRTPTCHATCIDYAIAKAFHDAEGIEYAIQRDMVDYAAGKARDKREVSEKRRRALRGYTWRSNQ